MRESIKICLIAFMAVLTTSSIFAQRGSGDRNPEDRATKITERMTEALELNAAQAEKVKAIHLKYGERMKAMRSKSKDTDRSQKRAAMEQMRTDIDAEIKTVLTEEQYQKFQEMPRPRQGKRGHGKKGGKFSKEAKMLHQEKIRPILLEQRAKLESKISDDDKATLAQLRLDIQKEKAAHKAKRKEMKQSSEKRERPSPEERAQRKAERKNNPTRLEVIALTEKYSADIEPLLAEVEPQIKALKEEWKKEKNVKGDKERKGKRGHLHMEGKDKAAHKEKHQNRKYARFLLLDPNATVDQEPLTPQSTISKVRVYPNPSQGISQIEYELNMPGVITIELHDKSGNLIETIEQSNKAAGKHKTSVNFGKYTVGVYFVVLKDADGQVTSKKVIR